MLYIYVYMYIYIYSYIRGITTLERKIQPVTIIANGEINKNGIIFFEYFLE